MIKKILFGLGVTVVLVNMIIQMYADYYRYVNPTPTPTPAPSYYLGIKKEADGSISYIMPSVPLEGDGLMGIKIEQNEYGKVTATIVNTETGEARPAGIYYVFPDEDEEADE